MTFNKKTIEREAKALKSFFSKKKEVQLAYLFGSHAKNPTKNSRDLDIAVMLNKALTGEVKFNYQEKLIQELENLFASQFDIHKPIDVVLMNSVDAILRFQILKYGEILFERKKKSDRDLKVKVMTEYEEAKRYLDFFYQKSLGVKHG